MSQLNYRVVDGHFHLTGELSFASVAHSDALIRECEAASQQITIDMAEVEHADSAATALMVELHRRVNSAGGQLNFINIPEHLFAVLEMTNLDQLLPINR